MLATQADYDARAKARAIETARQWFNRGFILIDTETTGIDETGEIVQIAILSHEGDVLLNSLVKPLCPIDETGRAFAVHGIGNDQLADAPPFEEVWPGIISHISGRLVIAYNCDFDYERIRVDWNRLPAPHMWPAGVDWDCAMKLYAEYAGVPGRYGYKWHKLTAACERECIEVEGAHDAMGDAKMTLELLRRMAG